jgi:hypothetical protein
VPTKYDLMTIVVATSMWACIEEMQSWLVPDAATRRIQAYRANIAAVPVLSNTFKPARSSWA